MIKMNFIIYNICSLEVIICKVMPDSLKQIIERKPILEHHVRGLPNLGENLIDGQFSKEVSKIYDAFELYGNDLYELENEKIKNISSRSLGGGSPMRTSSFPLCKEALINVICSDEAFGYPMAAGDEESREIILEYLKQEGFKVIVVYRKIILSLQYLQHMLLILFQVLLLGHMM